MTRISSSQFLFTTLAFPLLSLAACGVFDRADSIPPSGAGTGGTGGTAMGMGGVSNTPSPATTGGSSSGGPGFGCPPGMVCDGEGTGGAATGGSSGNAGTNLITNGDFSGGGTGWNVAEGLMVTDGKGCISNTEGMDPKAIGWEGSGGIALAVGSYTLSYSMTVTGTPSVVAKVSGVEDPYTPVLLDEDLGAQVAGTTAETHTVTVAEAATAIGLAIMVSGAGTVCVDDVSLTAN